MAVEQSTCGGGGVKGLVRAKPWMYYTNWIPEETWLPFSPLCCFLQLISKYFSLHPKCSKCGKTNKKVKSVLLCTAASFVAFMEQKYI